MTSNLKTNQLMINAIPIIGWLLSLLFSISVSIPFWFLWTSCNFGTTYFQFLPTQYQSIPFWDCVGLFIIISILKSALMPSVSASASADKE